MTYISGSDSNVLSLRLPQAVFHSILFYSILLLVSLQNARWIQLQTYTHAHILCHPSIHFCSHFLVCLPTHKYAIFFSPSLPYAQIVSTGMHRHTQAYSSFFSFNRYASIACCTARSRFIYEHIQHRQGHQKIDGFLERKTRTIIDIC